MKIISKRALDTFKAWGKRGGKKRAQNLSSSRRRSISKHAACVRWASRKETETSMSSVRLKKALWEEPVYIEEILTFGGVGEWRELHRIVKDRPFGVEAIALGKVIHETNIYGTTVLWRGILKYLQGEGQ